MRAASVVAALHGKEINCVLMYECVKIFNDKIYEPSCWSLQTKKKQKQKNGEEEKDETTYPYHIYVFLFLFVSSEVREMGTCACANF